MKWKLERADKFCKSVRDGTHDTPKQVDFGFKLITAKNIKNGQVDLGDAYNISEKDYIKINERSKVEKWDVLMSMIGNGLGRSAVIKDNPKYAIKNLALFKIGNEVKAKWLHYFLCSNEGQGIIFNTLQGSGQPFISLNLLRGLLIPVPPLTVMKKVIKILSLYDDLIENNQKQIKFLEEAAQRLYKEWFVDLRFPGYENTPIIDGLPEGWNINRADFFYDITIGKTPSRNDKQCFVKQNIGVPWVSISDMGNINSYVLNTAENLTREAVKKYNVKVVPPGTILLSFKLTVGRVAITSTGMCTNEAIAHFYINYDYQRTYTYFYLKNFKYNILGNTSAISKAVNSQIIKAMPVIMPRQEVIKEFSGYVTPILEQIKNKQFLCLKLTEARDRLLTKLMSGEIEV